MSPRPVFDSARLAWWLTSWLRGTTRPGELFDAVLDGDAAHHVVGLPDDVEPIPLLLALPALRRTGATYAGLALPAPGDPVGLGGPPDFNRAALESGEAVVLDSGLGLVPHRAGAGVTWTVLPAAPRQLIDLHEAARQLRAALTEAATRLAALDVARWSPEVADELLNLRHRGAPEHPIDVPSDAVDLAARAQQALDIVAAGVAAESGAIDGGTLQQRAETLTGLERAARRAWVAAGSPEVWPPDPRPVR